MERPSENENTDVRNDADRADRIRRILAEDRELLDRLACDPSTE